MAFTLSQLQALEEAIAQGALSVRYGDKQVTYQSTAEMLKVRDMIRRELGLVESGAGRVYPGFSKGTR